MRAGRSVRRTMVVTFSPSWLIRVPGGMLCAPGPRRWATMVTSFAGLVPAEGDPIGDQQPFHLGGHGLENSGGRAPFRDQRRHPPQRRLLVGDLAKLGVELGVIEGHGELAGDQLDGVEPFGGERAADEPVFQQQHRLQATAVEDG